jgi:hypothetical protein
MNTKAFKNKYREKYICPIPKSTFTTFSDEGIMHFRAGKFRKALYCFDRVKFIINTEITYIKQYFIKFFA